MKASELHSELSRILRRLGTDGSETRSDAKVLRLERQLRELRDMIPGPRT
jgi:hypothetical protein